MFSFCLQLLDTVDNIYNLNTIGFLEGTLQYYYHATPGEPLQGYPGVTW